MWNDNKLKLSIFSNDFLNIKHFSYLSIVNIRLERSCSFTMVTPLLQRNMFYLVYGVMKATLVFSFIKIVTLVNQILFYVLRTTRGTRDCLYEDMGRKTMKLRPYNVNWGFIYGMDMEYNKACYLLRRECMEWAMM